MLRHETFETVKQRVNQFANRHNPLDISGRSWLRGKVHNHPVLAGATLAVSSVVLLASSCLPDDQPAAPRYEIGCATTYLGGPFAPRMTTDANGNEIPVTIDLHAIAEQRGRGAGTMDIVLAAGLTYDDLQLVEDGDPNTDETDYVLEAAADVMQFDEALAAGEPYVSTALTSYEGPMFVPDCKVIRM